MGKLRSALCALSLVLLAPLVVLAWRALPLDARPLVAERYAGWSGVLRLWVYEGWESGAGSVAPWLNRCIARFEKRNPGVYVQPRPVDAGAMTALNDSGILPPDMLLFPPGLLDSPAGLAPLSLPDGLRPGLARTGARGGACYAVPVAMGGYLWAWNPTLTDGIPGSWREADAAPSAPLPEAWRRWDAALLALCAAAPSAGPGAEAAATAPPGLDLGLDAGPPEAEAPVPDDAGVLPCRLPADFQFDGDAWTRFINGEAAAIPVTQREVRRLQALSDRGRGPEWRLTGSVRRFTDQLLSLALVDGPRDDGRRQLCERFLECLLEEESQGELWRAGAFGVTDAPSGYPAQDPLAQMDAALRSGGLCAPNSFDRRWTSGAEAIVREWISDSAEYPLLWRRFEALFAENPNNTF